LAHDPTDAVGAEVTPGHGRHGRAPRQGGASLAPTPALEASTLRELGRLAGLVQPRLLALHLARVARQEALPLERHAELRVRLDERPGDAVPDRARLAADAAAVHAHAQVVRARGASDLERRHRELAVQGPREVLLERPAVDPRLPVARTQDDPRDRRLALARAQVLR